MIEKQISVMRRDGKVPNQIVLKTKHPSETGCTRQTALGRRRFKAISLLLGTLFSQSVLDISRLFCIVRKPLIHGFPQRDAMQMMRSTRRNAKW